MVRIRSSKYEMIFLTESDDTLGQLNGPKICRTTHLDCQVSTPSYSRRTETERVRRRSRHLHRESSVLMNLECLLCEAMPGQITSSVSTCNRNVMRSSSREHCRGIDQAYRRFVSFTLARSRSRLLSWWSTRPVLTPLPNRPGMFVIVHIFMHSFLL